MKDIGAIMADNSNKFDEAFNAHMEGFKVTTGQSMGHARELANMAISVFAESGNLSYAERFVGAIDSHAKDYVRKQAFLAWLAYHSPIEVDENGTVVLPLKKDKSEGWEARFKVEAAHLTSFWEFKREAPIKAFGSTDVIKALNAAVTKFENGNKYRSEGIGNQVVAEASLMIAELKIKVAEMLKPQPALVPVSVQPVIQDEPVEPPLTPEEQIQLDQMLEAGGITTEGTAA